MTSDVSVSYKGDLYCDINYNPSNYKVSTSVKKDDFFSPSELVAGALGACTVSSMAFKAETAQIPVDAKDISLDISIIKQEEPHKILGFKTVITVKGADKLTDKDKALLEGAAKSCPVKKMMSADLEQDISFVYE